MTEHRDVVSSVVIPDEGVALVFVKEGGIAKVQPSLGVAGEIFAGVSLARNVPPAFVPMVEEFVIGAGLSKTLLRAPLSGQIQIKVDGVSKTIVAAAPANAAQVMVVGSALGYFAGEVNKTCTVQYMYEPTVVEASLFVGQAIIGGMAFQSMSVVGLITRGDITTNHFDASVDWSNAMAVKLGANGNFTTTGSGITVPNAIVLNSPNVENPMLTIRLNS
jgi:hypothetical protein